MGSGSEDFRLQVFFKSGHDAQRADQRGDTERDAGDGDDRVERDRPVAALGAQVPQADEYFVGFRHHFSGRSCGNRITSRIDAWFVKSITSRSMPMPSPA